MCEGKDKDDVELSIGNPSQSYKASPAIWDHSVSCHPTWVNVPTAPP